jgi:hypothetical protein
MKATKKGEEKAVGFLLSSLGATDTEHRVWLNIESLKRDIFVAASALSVGAFVDSLESAFGSLELVLLSPAQFEGHLLGLHRVHAREPSDRGV